MDTSSPLSVSITPPAPLAGMPLVTVTLAGEFTTATVDDVQAQVEPYLAGLGAGSALALDLTNVRFMNSKAIGLIVSWHLLLSESGSRIVLVAPQPQVLDVLHSTGVTKLLAHGATIDLALANTPDVA